MGITQARLEAQEVIRVCEKALVKHIQLVKKRKHVSSIVATLERLKNDMRSDNPEAIYEHIAKLNQLTRGFAGHALKTAVKKIKK